MKLKIIESDIEYQKYIDWIDLVFDKGISPETPEGENLRIVLLLIKEYEDKHYSIPLPDPIEAIKSKMIDLGLKNKNLIGKVGSKGYVSAILNKRKPLTLELARLFHKELGIPAEILLS